MVYQWNNIKLNSPRQQKYTGGGEFLSEKWWQVLDVKLCQTKVTKAVKGNWNTNGTNRIPSN